MSVFDWLTTASSNGNSDATINFQENQAPSTVNDSARALMARVAYWVKMFSGNNTQGGSSNAYTITTGESLSAYAANMRFLWTPNADSTGASTLNVDAIGAKKVYLPTGVQAGSGDIESNAIYDVVYQTALDSAAGGFKIVGSDSGAEALAVANAALPSSSYTAADVLTKIKTVDGAGSGLDADTVDGVEASALARTAGGTITGTIQVTGQDDPASGSGIEMLYSGGSGIVQAYNRTGSAWLPVTVSGLTFTLKAQTATTMSVTSANALTISAATVSVDQAVQMKGSTFPSTGVGLELGYNGSFGIVQAYDRDTPGYKPILINARGAARVNTTSGTTTANSGLISWGTAAPGTLDQGQIYLRHA